MYVEHNGKKIHVFLDPKIHEVTDELIEKVKEDLDFVFNKLDSDVDNEKLIYKC